MLENETDIQVELSSVSSISANVQNIDYIPGYREAEELRRSNETVRISNENTRIANEKTRQQYINDLKSEVSAGKFNGATFTPIVDEESNLSWTNDKGLDNPATVNIKGDKGDQGEQGIQGEKGDQGEQGIQGIQGEKGDRGEQGIQGEKGDKGDSGSDGKVQDVKVNGTSVLSSDNEAIITLPTKLSELTNDSDFITKSVNDLTNYYLKSETYTKTEVNTLINNITKVTIQIVDTLPTTGESNVIYFVSKNGSDNDVYNEYIYINSAWECIGSTDVDLNDYYNKTQVDDLLDDKASTSSIPTKVSELTNDTGYTTTNDTGLTPLIVGTQTASTNVWLGVAPFDSLEDGQTIFYYLPYAGTSTQATLNLTLPDGTTTGAYKVYFGNGTTGMTTQYGRGSIIHLTFRNSRINSSGTTITNSWLTSDYDTTVPYRLRYENYCPYIDRSVVTNNTLYRYQLIFGVSENKVTPLNNNSNTTSTTKTMLTSQPFDPFAPISYYNSSTTVTTAAIGKSVLYQVYTDIDLRYTFNCGTTLTANKNVYAVCTIESGKAYITSPYYTQTLPTTADGLYYILLGFANSTYKINLFVEHPVYYYGDNGVAIYTNGSEAIDVSGKEDTSNKITTITGDSDDTQYPSAKAVYDLVYNIFTNADEYEEN